MVATHDGGGQWTVIRVPGIPQSMCFMSPATVLPVTREYRPHTTLLGPIVVRTVNGGRDWAPASTASATRESIRCGSDGRAWLAAAGEQNMQGFVSEMVYVTTTAGRLWHPSSSSTADRHHRGRLVTCQR